MLQRRGFHRPSLVIGRDTRASGPTLERALEGGIRLAGGDVLLAGVQTTPAVAFLTVDLGAASGVVISASHNPPEYNGIKFFDGNGYKYSEALEDEVEGLVAGAGEYGSGDGETREAPDATERYLRHLVRAAEAPLSGMRVAVDCANGAASGLAPEALKRLGADVTVLFDEPNGENINVGCGAMHPEIVAEAVREAGADAGVAHDGDADRALFADAEGRIVDGDQVIAACAMTLRKQGRLPGNTVVTTVMANLGFMRCMEEAGIGVVTTKVGDRFVLEKMRQTDALLGGEQSGHIIFREHATTGDGILTAIKLLSFAVAHGTSVADFVSPMRRFPQVLENVEGVDKERLPDAQEVWDAVRAAESELGSAGRVLVRASGTEPLVRVMVEAETQEAAQRHAEAIAGVVRSALA
jgi:phosphoglucosamine mutase